MDTEVLIVGAGPVGLMLGAELALAGVRALIVEQLDAPSSDRKARGLGPLPTEALHRRGLHDRLNAHSDAGWADYQRDHGAPKGHFAWIHKIDYDATRPLTFIWQPDLEAVLTDHAVELGVPIRRGHQVTGWTEDDTGVTATLTGAPPIRARYLVGCDGGRSGIRKQGGFDFPGTAPMLVMRAGQLRLAGRTPPPRPGRYPRGSIAHGITGDGVGLLGVTEFDGWPEDRDTPLTIVELTEAVSRVAGVELDIEELTEPRRILDNARLVSEYRRGRVLLAGDSAHVHSPNGGQGLSLGLMDAANLGWKLAAQLHGIAAPGLLDSYHAERHPAASAVLHNTRAQSALLAPGPHVDALRDVVADLMDIPEVNAYFAELLGGLRHRYPLPYPAGSHPLLGAHLPDCPVATADGDTTLYELTRDGTALALLAPGRTAPNSVASTAIRTVTLTGPPRPPGYPELVGAFVRPDGVLAWSDEPGAASLATAVGAWYQSSPG